jgi:hypothetical protein
MKQIAYISVLLLIGSLQVMGQEVEKNTAIDRNIEVVKEYNPVIQEAGKINTMPELKDIESRKIQVGYQVWTLPVTPPADVIPALNYATVSTSSARDYKDGFIKIGGGNYTSFIGEIYTPVFKDSKHILDAYIKHNSSFGNIKLTPELYPLLPEAVPVKGLANDNKAKMSFLRSIRNKEFSSFIGFGYNRFNYYGYDSYIADFANDGTLVNPARFDEDYHKQAFFNADANLRYRTKEYISGWKYDLQTNYNLFRNRNKLMEHTIYTDLFGAYRMESSSIGATMKMYNMFMNRPENTALYQYDEKRELESYTVIKINPYYAFEGEPGQIVLGIKGNFSIGHGRPGSISPDIYGTVKIMKDKLYLYAGVTGDFTVNNYRHMTSVNPYISPDVRVEDTYIPIDVYAGTKVNFFNQLNLDFFIGYKIINNPYFFVNKTDDHGLSFYNTFDVVTDKDAGLFNTGLSLLYNWHDRLHLTFKSKYNKWSLDKLEKPWYKPAFEMDFQAAYNITDYLSMNAFYHTELNRYAQVNGETVSLKNIHDISVGANYKLLSFVNIFLNLNNLLGLEYSDWYGYNLHRFNAMVGASVTF